MPKRTYTFSKLTRRLTCRQSCCGDSCLLSRRPGDRRFHNETVAALTTVFTDISTVAAAHNASRVAAAVAAAAAGVVATVTAVVGVLRKPVVWLGPGVGPQLLGIRQTVERQGTWAVVASHLLALDGIALQLL